MTSDHIETFSEAMDAERRAYVVLIRGRDKSAYIRDELDHWPPRAGMSKHRDALNALAAAFSSNGERLTVLAGDDLQTAATAIETLRYLLEQRGEQLNEREAALYKRLMHNIRPQ